VNAAFATGLPLKVLHRIRNIRLLTIDASFNQRLVEKRACRADKGFAFEVFLIARLLAHEHHLRMTRPFAKHRLRSAQPQIAGFAIPCHIAELRQRRMGGNQLRRRGGLARRLRFTRHSFNDAGW